MRKNAVAALDNVADDEEYELVGLSADVERGESDMAMPGEYYGIEEEDSLDNEEGWVDEVALLVEDEQIELQRNIRPVKLVLLKVR